MERQFYQLINCYLPKRITGESMYILREWIRNINKILEWISSQFQWISWNFGKFMVCFRCFAKYWTENENWFGNEGLNISSQQEKVSRIAYVIRIFFLKLGIMETIFQKRNGESNIANNITKCQLLSEIFITSGLILNVDIISPFQWTIVVEFIINLVYLLTILKNYI